MGEFRLSKRSKNNREGVDSRLIEISDRAIQITRVDFGVPGGGGLRTAEYQNGLFILGKSKADGYDKIGKHQTGKALDFYAYVNGGATWEPEYMAQVACAHMQAAMELGYTITWGGLWVSLVDMPHIQLAGDT